MTFLHWVLLLGCLPAAFFIVHDIRAGWKEREFWLDPHFDDDGYQP